MKTIDKIKALAVSLFVIATTSACTSDYNDPDVIYKGEIDSSFLSSLSRGENTITFEIMDCYKYYKDYSSSKWNISLSGHHNTCILPKKFTIFQGRTWCLLELAEANTEGVENLINFVWTRYCNKNTFYKDIYVADQVEYNATTQTIRLNENIFEIEKANENNLTISYICDEFLDNVRKNKIIIQLNKKDFQKPDTDNILYFETRKDALLKMLEMMRSYYGDIFQASEFEEPNISLVVIEDIIKDSPNLKPEGYGPIVW